MTPNGRGSSGISADLVREHPGNAGASPYAAPVDLRARDSSARRVATSTRSSDATPRTRSMRSRALLVVRRTHLVLGLLLLPFVALYGATAILFNHASWFQPVEERALDRDVVATSALATLTADPLAAARAIAPGVDVRDARWEGAWRFETRGDGRFERFDVDARGRGGRALVRDEDPRTRTALPEKVAASSLPGWSDPTALAASLAPDLGLRAANVATKRAPRLAFRFEEDGRALLARWDPADGALRVEPDDGRDAVSFLLTLHKSHGAPGFVDARWWWSWIVDLMGAAMLAWAVSGVVLWWSIRAVRRLGLVVLALAAAGSLALFAGMHAAIPT